ncbi:MAG: S1C family serine protease, partial [Lachnospiraceae bacterium]|nr:S1C family serine protease [Lachnospiraceae bacterium]
MTERRKKILDEKEHEKKKYKFIREQVKPQKRKRIMRTVRRLFITVLLATVFGSVSAVVFCTIMQNMMNNDEKEVVASGSTLNDDNTLSDDTLNNSVNDTDDDQGDDSDADKIYEYSKLSRSIASVGEACKYSLVTVKGYKRGEVLNSIVGERGSHDSYGVIVKEDYYYYYIVTKAVTVINAGSIEVEFYNQTTVHAEVSAADKNIDLAVIKVKKEKVDSTTKSGVKIANYASINSNLAVGSKVIAVGAPSGVMYSVMIGTITQSQIRASVPDNEIKLLSTDIPRSPDTNGIILNTRGCITGFITDSFENIMGDTVVGFVELSSIQDVLRLMIEGKNAPYLGIEGKDVDSESAKNHNIEEGIYVTSVYPNSPAYNSGMRVADIITKVNEKKINSVSQLHTALMGTKYDNSIKITVARKYNGKIAVKKITVKPE